ncbi:glycosyltransferase [uncultured Winogradskyella sp.]|uniref:glycosyltransferase n=1 Tax=uncultured Winogradskyella sp. TaxID=395353 RepID=UPI0026173931|nr:glycosyltransferase [uncultured Winogradskyella sp.]
MKKSNAKKKRILVAPLNWGLGHATRCIPIINALISNGFEPLIASDGVSLKLLQKEFPKLSSFKLPSYNITYPKQSKSIKLKLIKDAPYLLKTIKQERKAIDHLVNSEDIAGIISDNRFGIRHKNVPSVFITHQLQVLSGNTTWLSSKLHQNIIKKFDECWVPDYKEQPNLSGCLGHLKNQPSHVKHIGPLSRFKKLRLPIKHDLLIILSGLEPQRTYLEEKLLLELQCYNGKACLIKGLIETEQRITKNENVLIYNFMTSAALENALNESRMVLSRSGYTSIMDYAKLEKKVFFIPTPGQNEQEYLADKFKKEVIAPTCRQNEFKIAMLNTIEPYTGFKDLHNNDVNYKELFSLF